MAGGVAFAGQAAGIGMAIVFAFLTLMSLLMVAMRALDELGAKRARRDGANRAPSSHADKTSAAAHAGAASAAASTSPRATKRIPEWAIAAAVVYLAAEEQRERHSAAAWTTHRFGGSR